MQVVLYDTEYWTDFEAPKRGWLAVTDLPRYLFQIAAIKVDISDDCRLVSEFSVLVKPKDTRGDPVLPNSFFSQLTGIEARDISRFGQPIEECLPKFFDFCRRQPTISYGHDLTDTIAPSCIAAQIPFTLNPAQFIDFRQFLLAIGLGPEEINRHSSGTIFSHFDLELDAENVHNAQFDVESLYETFRFLNKSSENFSVAFESILSRHGF